MTFLVVSVFVGLKISGCIHIARSWQNCSYGKRKLTQSRALNNYFNRLGYDLGIHVLGFCDKDADNFVISVIIHMSFLTYHYVNTVMYCSSFRGNVSIVCF